MTCQELETALDRDGDITYAETAAAINHLDVCRDCLARAVVNWLRATPEDRARADEFGRDFVRHAQYDTELS